MESIEAEQVLLDRLHRLLGEQDILLNQDAISRCANRRDLRKQTGDLLESAFIELATSLIPDISIEIGAHEASYSERLKANLPQVHAFAFEANPHVYRRHAGRLRAPEVDIDYRHAAICGKNGSAEFHIVTKVRGAPISRRNQRSGLHNRLNTDIEYETVSVPASTLDSAVAPIAAKRAVAWIDAEGAQSEILAGGREFFARVIAIYIEVERQQIWRDQRTVGEIAANLADFSLVPIMRDNLAQQQCNEVYIRPEPTIVDAALGSIERYIGELRQLATD